MRSYQAQFFQTRQRLEEILGADVGLGPYQAFYPAPGQKACYYCTK